MNRLVMVSNRLPPLETVSQADKRRSPVGGLTSGLMGALRRAPGSLWFGWSGAVTSTPDETRFQKASMAGVHLLGMSLTEKEVAEFYRGFANGALWPLFHGFQGRVKLDRGNEAGFRRVTQRFAAALRRYLKGGDVLWVHDYHFICLGRELRRLGWRGPIGYFLHIPFPDRDHWQILPEPTDFLDALMEYDLIGFQTQGSLDNYLYCCRRELGARWDGRRLTRNGRVQRAGVYAIGIDPEPFRPSVSSIEGGVLRGELARAARGRRLLLGVDRLDYTKGIPERILGYEAFLKGWPQYRGQVIMTQIATPSRSRVPEYIEQKQRLDWLVGRVNGEFAEHDWMPIRYLYRSYAPAALAQFYRSAAVGLVTPLRDGMNLIAKEFVAAQDPASPGVLVLSRFAGAADQLREAVMVNPYIPTDTAAAIQSALSMPLDERRERHSALLRTILDSTASAWSDRFLADLEAAAVRGGGSPAIRSVARPISPGGRAVPEGA